MLCGCWPAPPARPVGSSRLRARRGAARRVLQARASLTPQEVLGVPYGASAAEVKAAFRARLKTLHPDVNPSSDATEATLRLVRAFELLSAEAATATAYSDDPFAEPEGPATVLFVNELRCQGRSCSSCCVDKAPEVFQFGPDTGAARAANEVSVSGGKEYVLRVAVGQCPTECIHWVTPRQRDVLDAQMLSAREGRAPLDEVGAVCAELLARASFENGRERRPRRTPTSSTQYVDWY